MSYKFTEKMCWDRGISTRFAKELTPNDVREFIEEVLDVKCGRIGRGINKNEHGIRFNIKGFSIFDKFFYSRSNKKNSILQLGKGAFVAYDFNFIFMGERITSESDKQAWIDFMQRKFGKEYEKFMFVYTE